MKSKTKKKIENIFWILTLLLMILTTISAALASTYSEIRELGQNMESPEQIHNYLWRTNHYEFFYQKRPLSVYWETRIGDCTEVARVDYIMFKSIGYKSRISHGYLNGYKHDYTEYYKNGEWISPNPKITREGRGIW